METPIFKFALREGLADCGINFLPMKGEPFATGWDVRACQHDRKSLAIRPGSYFKIPLGFRAFPEEGWWFQLHPRSSSFAKKNMHCLIGTIDNHYSNEVILAGQYSPDLNSMCRDLIINFGDPIGQIIPFKKVEMTTELISNQKYDELCSLRKSERIGGFGSTDR